MKIIFTRDFPTNTLNISPKLSQALFDFINMELDVVDDCVIVSQSANPIPQGYSKYDILKSFTDFTAFEASVNDIWVNEYFQNSTVGFDEMTSCAVLATQIFALRIGKTYQPKRFEFVLSIDIESKTITLHFYQLRDNEIPWLSPEAMEREGMIMRLVTD